MSMAGKPKNIVICYDGTGNEYGRNNTNVVKAFEWLERDDEQIAFYDPGVGTFSFLGRVLGRRIGILMGKMFGAGLVQNVEDGYEYLMNRYRPGDHVYIFGFSRGAFTARVLAGMLTKVGLLQKGSKNLIPYATKMNFNEAEDAVVTGFRNAYCQDCDPHFVGVWDTVASLGFVLGKKFSNNRLSPRVRYGAHAISIDEKRRKFPVSLWDEPHDNTEGEIDQVWFAGVHSDVGGWYDERGLSDISFRWMMKKATNAGLRLKSGWQDALAPDPSIDLHISRSGFWKIWPVYHRPRPGGARIHRSVEERIAKRPDYVLSGMEGCVFADDPDAPDDSPVKSA